MNLKTRGYRYARIVSLILLKQGLSGATIASASRGARHLSLGVRLVNPTEIDKAIKVAEAVALAANSDNVIAARRAGLIVYQFQLSQGYWEYYTRADLPGPNAVGLAEQRQPILFELDPPHCLIAGTTGSGKSETVKSVLLSLVSTHTPEELQVVLIDPDNEYSGFANIAHLGMPIVGSDKEAIERAIAWAYQETVKRRMDDIKDAHKLVLAIDEAESDTVLGDDLNRDRVTHIARDGRKYNVHLLITAKRPSQRTLPSLVDQLMNRFIGLLSNASESAMITGHAGLDAHKLTGKGDFLHIAGPACDRFQVALAKHSDFDRLPRCEAKTVEIEPCDFIPPDPGTATDKPPGRPALIVEPEIAARYYYRNPNRVSISMANELFGLSRTGHNLHKDFVIRFSVELRKLVSKGE